METSESPTPRSNSGANDEMQTGIANSEVTGELQPGTVGLESERKDTKCHLLSIPRELRDKIYRNILVADNTLGNEYPEFVLRTRQRIERDLGLNPLTRDFFQNFLASLLDTRILRANKQILEEALQVLTEENTFWALWNHDDGPRAPQKARNIKVLSIVTVKAKAGDLPCKKGDLNRLFNVLISQDVDLKSLQLEMKVSIDERLSKGEYRRILNPLLSLKVNSVVLVIDFFDHDEEDVDDSKLSKECRLFKDNMEAVVRVMKGETSNAEFEWPEMKEIQLASE